MGAKSRRVKISQLLYGISTFLPGVAAIFGRGGGDSNSGRYCYSIWLRHLVTAFENGWREHPRVVAELGPGDSLGVGLAALVSGVEAYHAFDVVKHARVKRNLEVLAEIVELFRSRAPIPDDDEFPEVRPRLGSYAFPHHVFTDATLDEALAEARLARIRDSVAHQNSPGSMIDYRTRWFDDRAIERDSIDLVFSQAVLEHVDDLPSTYRAMQLWLKPNGLASHQIDFRCHNTAHAWNGHWRYSDRVWRLIRGKRSYLLNREPFSRHVRFLEDNGFAIIGSHAETRASEIDRADLAPRFRALTDADLTTCSGLLQAVKRSG
jgi:hypothetical protein